MKTLKLDIQQQNIWFTADTHFNHANIIKYCNRPFDSVGTMDNAMILKWNKVVQPNDVVFHLGDFCFGNMKSWVYFLHNLNGYIYLMQGNHDKDNNIPFDNFERVEQLYNLLIQGDEEIPNGQRITVCHYPMLSWYQSHRGSWQLYGHVHGRLSNKGDLRTTPNQLDVGVDVHNFTPLSYEDVKVIITKQNLKT